MIGLVLALAASTLATTTAESPSMVRFNIGTVALELPLPSTYCLPEGNSRATAQVLAAGDTMNVTMVTLFSCKRENGENKDYSVIKTPRNLLLTHVDLVDLQKNVGAEFDKPKFKTFLAETVGPNLSGSVSEAMGARIKLSSNLEPLGKDDVCAYLGGIINVETPTDKFEQPVAGCITVVQNRVVTVYRYGPDATTAGVATLAKQARAIALTIQPARRDKR